MGRPCRGRNECIIVTEWNDLSCASPGDSESTAWEPRQDTPSLWPDVDQLTVALRLPLQSVPSPRL